MFTLHYVDLHSPLLVILAAFACIYAFMFACCYVFSFFLFDSTTCWIIKILI